MLMTFLGLVSKQACLNMQVERLQCTGYGIVSVAASLLACFNSRHTF